MNLGPDADPMEAFRELFGQFAGQGGGSAPATGGRIASQPLPDLTPRPSPVAPAPQEYNPLDDVDSEPAANDMSDAAVNKRAWLAQDKNLPQPSQAPMGKRRAAPTGIQQSPGTSQPTQGQAPVPGSGAPKTPPPGATAASVMTTPPSKSGQAGGDSVAPGIPSGFTPEEDAMMADPNLSQPTMPNQQPRVGPGESSIARLWKAIQPSGAYPYQVTNQPVQGTHSGPQMPPEMLLQMIADRQRNGRTQGNTPIR